MWKILKNNALMQKTHSKMFVKYLKLKKARHYRTDQMRLSHIMATFEYRM